MQARVDVNFVGPKKIQQLNKELRKQDEVVYNPKLSLRRRDELRQKVVELYGLDFDPIRDFMDRSQQFIKGVPTTRDLKHVRFSTPPARGVN